MIGEVCHVSYGTEPNPWIRENSGPSRELDESVIGATR